MQSVEEIAAYYEANPGPECPTCHSAKQIVTTISGRPSSELVAYAARPDSRVRLGGCTREPGAKKYYCRSCKASF